MRFAKKMGVSWQVPWARPKGGLFQAVMEIRHRYTRRTGSGVNAPFALEESIRGTLLVTVNSDENSLEVRSAETQEVTLKLQNIMYIPT